MKYRSAFKTLILCPLRGSHSFQGFSQLTFPSFVGLLHSASHYFPLQVGLRHCEKCGSATFKISLPGWIRQFLTVAYMAIRSLHFPHLWAHHRVNYIVLPHMWDRHTVRIVGPPQLRFLFSVGQPSSSLCNHSFQSYQNPTNGRS